MNKFSFFTHGAGKKNDKVMTAVKKNTMKENYPCWVIGNYVCSDEKQTPFWGEQSYDGDETQGNSAWQQHKRSPVQYLVMSGTKAFGKHGYSHIMFFKGFSPKNLIHLIELNVFAKTQ